MLRQVLENLIKLSFDQENLLQVNMNSTNSPEFVNIVKFQKISDDSQIIQDSLLALAKELLKFNLRLIKKLI